MKKILKKEYAIPFLIGIAGFILTVGVTVLDFKNIGWLSKGDALFNYIGWEIYRYGPWMNPIGLNPNYGLEFSSSIVYSDSIPILAIFFKCFSNLIGEPFQYFGLWLLICFILQAFFGFKIASLLTQKKSIKFCITIFFVFMPVMLFRTGIHLALAGHFVILWALYINLEKQPKRWESAFLVFLVLGIHFYLFVMVAILWLGGLMDKYFSSRIIKLRYFVSELLIVCCVILLSAWQYGYFAISLGESSAFGYGGDRINLLAFFNPLSWSLINKFNLFEPPTIEGFAYLGGGILLAFLLSIFLLNQSNIRKEFIKKVIEHKFMLASVIFMTMVAITHNIDIGNSQYRIPFDNRLFNIFGAVRSSARLIWPLQYLIIIFSSWAIIHGFHKRLAALFTTLCAIQVIDTSKGWVNLHTHFSNLASPSIEHSLKHEFWKEVPKKYSSIRIISPYWGNWNTVGLYAAQNKMATNSVFLARVDKNKLEESIIKQNAEVSSGRLDSKTIYLFQNWNSDINLPTPRFDPKRDLYAKVNGVTLLAPEYKTCNECKQIDPALEISSLMPIIKLNENIQFSNGSRGGELLLEGWSHSEAWGVWSSGNSSLIAIPLGNNAPSNMEITFRVLLGPYQPFSNIKILINGQTVGILKITNASKNKLNIAIPPNHQKDKFILLKFEFLNPISPKNAGIGNEDTRLLTLGLESIQLKK